MKRHAPTRRVCAVSSPAHAPRTAAAGCRCPKVQKIRLSRLSLVAIDGLLGAALDNHGHSAVCRCRCPSPSTHDCTATAAAAAETATDTTTTSIPPKRPPAVRRQLPRRLHSTGLSSSFAKPGAAWVLASSSSKTLLAAPTDAPPLARRAAVQRCAIKHDLFCSTCAHALRNARTTRHPWAPQVALVDAQLTPGITRAHA